MRIPDRFGPSVSVPIESRFIVNACEAITPPIEATVCGACPKAMTVIPVFLFFAAIMAFLLERH